jgi:cation:H+ antiporter
MQYFFVSYIIAVAAGFVPLAWVKHLMGAFLICYYCYYVYRTLVKSKAVGFDEQEELAPLFICKILQKNNCTSFLIGLQIVLTLVLLVVFAHLFVGEIKFFSAYFNINPLILSLIIAPIATELPEKVNSIYWIKQHKDTLALGNITGAMVFQSAIPVSVGIFLTPWAFDNSSIANILMVFCASTLVYANVVIAKKLVPQVLCACGMFYLLFIAYILVNIIG